MHYALVTPAKNEEQNLPRLISSIASQTRRPLSWVVIDDGSQDSTAHLLQEAGKELPFLELITRPLQENPGYDRGFHYSFLVKQGLDLLLEGKEEKDCPEFVGICDADMFFRPDYFEKLMEKFGEEPRLGIASGALYSKRGNHFVRERRRINHPRGSGRLMRTSFYRESGGYKVYKAMDSVMNIKARNRGWKTLSFPELKMYQSRVSYSRRSYWHGYFEQGRMSAYLGFPLLTMLLKTARFLLLRPHYIFLPYLQGYFYQRFKKKMTVPDEEVRKYYKEKHLRVGFSHYFSRKRKRRETKKA